MRKAEDIKTRFERFIMPEPNTGCWLWMARINQRGYGIFGQSKIKHRAHRFSYELYNGKITNGLLVCHTCDMPSCVNPTHLFLGTHLDNARDMISKGRDNKSKGENHYKAKLLASHISEIKALRGEKSYRTIAKIYGISKSHVSQIIKGRLWRSV